jgi:putative ABC transport system permease protein
MGGRRMWLYLLRQAWLSLRRDRALSGSIVLCLALATSVWAMSLTHFLRVYGPRADADPDLHQVELVHGTTRHVAKSGSFGTLLVAQTRVSYPEYELLAKTGIPTRETATMRSRVTVGDEPTAVSEHARFVNADFFDLFRRSFRTGGPWTKEEDASGAPAVVLSRALGERLYGSEDPRGRELAIEGLPHRIVGVLAKHQPYLAEWDAATLGVYQDALYLPFESFRRLRAYPEQVAYQRPTGSGWEDLWRSDALVMTHWVELPTAQHRQAYTSHLREKLGGSGFSLRSLAEWREHVPAPDTPIRFFMLLTVFVLLGAGFNLSRLFLAKGLARTDEIGIYRTLGAPRRAICLRQMLEAALLCVPGSVLGVILSLPFFPLWNTIVRETDIPVEPSLMGAVLGALPGAIVGLLAALYPAWRISGVRCTITSSRRA